MASRDWLLYDRGDLRRLRACIWMSLLDCWTTRRRLAAPADCLILLPPGWRVTWESAFYSNFLAEDRMRMTNFLRSSSTFETERNPGN
jgi:hypothetical protein